MIRKLQLASSSPAEAPVLYERGVLDLAAVVVGDEGRVGPFQPLVHKGERKRILPMSGCWGGGPEGAKKRLARQTTFPQEGIPQEERETALCRSGRW